MNFLELEKVKAIGLSFGGLALLQFASLHPERIESMILIGVSQTYKENNELEDSFSYENLPESFIDELRKLHYHGESQIRALFDNNLDYQIDLTNQEIDAITSKTLIVQGDRDEILGIEAAIKLYQNLPYSELWVVPNTGHIAITASNKQAFLVKSMQFLTSKE